MFCKTSSQPVPLGCRGFLGGPQEQTPWDFCSPRSLQVDSKLMLSITAEGFPSYLPPACHTELRAAFRLICLPPKSFCLQLEAKNLLPHMTSVMFVGLASVHITRTSPFTLHQTTAWSPDHTDVCPLKLALPSARRQLCVTEPLDSWIFQNRREAATSRPQSDTDLCGCWVLGHEQTVGLAGFSSGRLWGRGDILKALLDMLSVPC